MKKAKLFASAAALTLVLAGMRLERGFRQTATDASWCSRPRH